MKILIRLKSGSLINISIKEGFDKSSTRQRASVATELADISNLE